VNLNGGKVVLREKRLEDAHDDYVWRSDLELAKLDAAPPLRMSYDEFAKYYRDELRFPVTWSRRFAITTSEGAHIGNCMYYDVDSVNRKAELGIMIGDRAYWDHGYGYDAMVTMIEYIFTHTNLTLLYLHTLEWNLRARKAFQKCGLREVGPVRKNGYRFVRMELEREEWQRIRAEKLALRDKGAPLPHGSQPGSSSGPNPRSA
jgi:RimJ/RimL family protein N-acetyltransferase